MGGKLMRAVQYESYGGGATVLKPITATDVAEEVLEIGAEAKKFRPGDKVVAVFSHFVGGGLAEFTVAKESARPPEVSPEEAAGLPIAGLTALQALTGPAGVFLHGGPTADAARPKNILVTAASGGVGHYAVQLAKLGNAHVTATCGARNLDFVKSLGADEVLDYRTPEGTALRSPSGKKYDAVIHCSMSAIPWSTFKPCLSEGGKVIDLTPGPRSMCTFVFQKLTFSRKLLVPLLMTPRADNLEVLVRLVKEGRLRTKIDSLHPLTRVEDGWAKSLGGHATGKLIIQP